MAVEETTLLLGLVVVVIGTAAVTEEEATLWVNKEAKDEGAGGKKSHPNVGVKDSELIKRRRC